MANKDTWEEVQHLMKMQVICVGVKKEPTLKETITMVPSLASNTKDSKCSMIKTSQISNNIKQVVDTRMNSTNKVLS
jgi:formylmethanofuran dehydrogenase subunit B